MERPDPTTIGQALQWAAERLATVTDRPHAEAERLLAHVVHVERTTLLAHPERRLSGAEADTYADLLDRRTSGFPLPYLLGEIEFYGLTFAVTPDVLIPRPETELLVDLALEKLHDWRRPRVIDVGTGSGCIAVSLAATVPGLRVYGTDISAAALRVARANSRRHGVDDRVAWLQADLLEPFALSLDLIVSNPPYVATSEWDDLPTSVREEPRGALVAGAEGLDVIRRLLAQTARRLSPTGCLLVEIGAAQGRAALALAEAAFSAPAHSDVEIRLHHDLAGKDRVLEISLSGPADEPALE